jgi:hypothetical protein
MEHFPAPEKAIVAQIGVPMALLGHPFPRLNAATAGDPDRWVWLLDRARPDIDVAQLRMFAIEGK